MASRGMFWCAGRINAYMVGLKECLKHVADYKLQIFITPHVDDGSTQGGVWRNAVDLDPIKRYDKWTYTGEAKLLWVVLSYACVYQESWM
jgi:hypothetical protein